MNLPPLPTRSASRGQSLVELALLLPLLVLLVLGVYDVARAIHAKNVLIHLSREGANLASRSPRSSVSLQQIMDSLASSAHPLSMRQDGMMYVTEISVRNGVRSVTQIAWGGNTRGPASEVNANDPAGVTGVLPVPDGTSAYIFEVMYTYHSLLLKWFSPKLRSATVF